MKDVNIIYMVQRLIETNKLLKSETRTMCQSEKDMLIGSARELSLILHKKTGKMLNDCDSAEQAGKILFGEED